jgi:quinol monooxygenase YgiN
MPATDQINVEPVPSDLEGGRGRPSLDLDSGPVVASTEYRISQHNVRAFLSAARRLQRMRRRNGARRWALLRDAADPEVWIERFETPTWLDHLRVRERMTVTDREVEDRVLTYHQGEGPPFARYLLSHIPVADGENTPNVSDPRTTVFDPSLPPGLSAERSA